MNNSAAAATRRRRRRHSVVTTRLRRHWADYVVIVTFVGACLVALLLLMDVIDNTISRPDKQGVTVKPSRAR
jgi:hypothetical protein